MALPAHQSPRPSQMANEDLQRKTLRQFRRGRVVESQSVHSLLLPINGALHVLAPRHNILAYHVVTLTACCKYRWRDESSETDEIQIYATSEERKQRNRQAQAAFRERRTEYIKQLENTIKHHEETLQTLQQSHRNAADECLMLRYKNSLLERILLEKGTYRALSFYTVQSKCNRPCCYKRDIGSPFVNFQYHSNRCPIYLQQ